MQQHISIKALDSSFFMLKQALLIYVNNFASLKDKQSHIMSEYFIIVELAGKLNKKTTFISDKKITVKFKMYQAISVLKCMEQLDLGLSAYQANELEAITSQLTQQLVNTIHTFNNTKQIAYENE